MTFLLRYTIGRQAVGQNLPGHYSSWTWSQGALPWSQLGSQQVDNATHEMLRVDSTDLEILLYVDANHRLLRLDVPSSKVTVQRE